MLTSAAGLGASSLGTGLPLEGGGYDLWGQVEEVAQVLDTLVGQVPVEVTPRELFSHQTLGLKGLKSTGNTRLGHERL